MPWCLSDSSTLHLLALPAHHSISYGDYAPPLTQRLAIVLPSNHTHLLSPFPISLISTGSLTLLLGPAGCGRSTLLKALCDQLQSSSMVCVQGLEQLRYNGQTTDTFVVQRTAAYVDQVRTMWANRHKGALDKARRAAVGVRSHAHQCGAGQTLKFPGCFHHTAQR